MSAKFHSDVVPVDEIQHYITEHFAGVDVVSAMGAMFFSLDSEKHWPNFATIVTTDEQDRRGL